MEKIKADKGGPEAFMAWIDEIIEAVDGDIVS